MTRPFIETTVVHRITDQHSLAGADDQRSDHKAVVAGYVAAVWLLPPVPIARTKPLIDLICGLEYPAHEVPTTSVRGVASDKRHRR